VPHAQSKYSAGIVIGRTAEETEKLRWLDNLVDVKPYVYIVDDNTTSELHLDANHGREAAVYFKYIVEFYDNLPDISFFWHGDDVVWHNNMLLGWNSSISINRMDRDNIIASGYAPSRCDAWPVCTTKTLISPQSPFTNTIQGLSILGSIRSFAR